MAKPHDILKVLGNQYRYKIVKILQHGEKNVSDINKSVPISQPALSQHLGKLARYDVLGSRREQRQIFYFIKSPVVLPIIGFLEQAGGAK